ncbi:hypothetical protein BB561_003576 [Smittium simulii]|uniref:Reverse transcriptase domain-containing protein n=1 Tax=Smittium simulii TaxID=133385 RepID=A0A2T9YKI9_9FUNG|nr:hypothetical protein BB561_003576 [Smittium simulii]
MIKAMYGTYSFLKNQNIPAAIRLKVLQSVLIPIGTYGGELFGMSEVRTRPIQIIADKSLQLIANVSKATAINRLRTEFGITSINSICSRARERAYFKWPISKTWIADLIRQPLGYQLKIGLNMIGKIRTGAYWTTERLAKSQLISKIYRKKCPCCNVNVPENIKHILLYCKRWAAIRSEKIGQFIPRLFRICNDNNNEPLTQAKIKLVGKLLGGESKKSLLQLRKEKKPNMLPSMELETAKFMDGIRVARTLILDGIKCSPTPLNRCPLKRQQQDQQANCDVIVSEITHYDSFIKTRVHITKLEAYSEISQTISAMQKDFFRSPMTEEECKDIIYSYPKMTGLNYTPPHLNDTASNTVKKLGSQLYGIQLNLANMTRPIDYFVHNRIINNPGAKPKSDDVLEFAEIMRVSISDLASSITQIRVDNLYKTMKLPTLYWHLRKWKRNPEEWATKSPFNSARKQRGRKNSPIIQDTALVGAPIIILDRVEEINEQSMGQRNCRERLQDTVQENRNSHTIFKILPQIPQIYPTTSPQLSHSFPKYTSQGAVTLALCSDVYPLTTHPHRYKKKMTKKANKAITDEQKTKNLRPVLDLRKLSGFIKEKNFKMESFASMCKILKRKDCLVSLDLEDAFLHILVHASAKNT